MENVFDMLKVETFDRIAETMGYTALWDGTPARVLFNDPSEGEKVGDYNYDYQRPTLEYKHGDWPGLRDLINDKSAEKITVRGKDYWTLKLIGDSKRATDGDVFTVILQEDKGD